jgi:RNA polymerase sigma factor (sigma-70 family)
MTEAEFAQAIRPLWRNLKIWARYYAVRTEWKDEWEDILQEALARAWKFVHQFTPGTNFGGWMRTIIRNTAIEYARRRRPFLLDVTDKYGRPLPMLTCHPPVAEDLGDEMCAAIELLNDSHKQVLVLSVLDELSLEEIARILNIPEGTVKSRSHRAKNFVADRIREYARTEYGIHGLSGNMRPMATRTIAIGC